MPPKTDGSGRDRKLLSQASDLLAAAGWTQAGNQLVDDEGAPLEVEFLIDASRRSNGCCRPTSQTSS